MHEQVVHPTDHRTRSRDNDSGRRRYESRPRGRDAENPGEALRHAQGRRDQGGQVVARRGVRLRRDLYPPEGPFGSRAEALRYERRTGNRLRHRGYRVYGAQGERFMKKKRSPQ